MRVPTAIGAVALCGLAAIVPAAGAPGTEAVRASIRSLEQTVLDADRGIRAARLAERRASERLAAAKRRLASTSARLDARAGAHRAGQAVLATRLREIYREGEADPLITVLLSRDGLAAVASTQAMVERAAREDARLVSRLRADRREVALIARARSREEVAARKARDEAAGHRADLEGLRAARASALAKARRALARIEARERRAGRSGDSGATDPIARGGATATTPRNGRWPAVPGGPSRAVLERIAWCESRGNPRSIGGGGQFRGKYQFMQSTWEAMGGTGDPAAATEAEQDYRAALLFIKWGPGQWPVCAAFAR